MLRAMNETAAVCGERVGEFCLTSHQRRKAVSRKAKRRLLVTIESEGLITDLSWTSSIRDWREPSALEFAMDA
jgi:hypothetical protein